MSLCYNKKLSTCFLLVSVKFHVDNNNNAGQVIIDSKGLIIKPSTNQVNSADCFELEN